MAYLLKAGWSINFIAAVIVVLRSAGNPKGVIITHGNLVSNLAGAYMQLVRGREGERERERGGEY